MALGQLEYQNNLQKQIEQEQLELFKQFIDESPKHQITQQQQQGEGVDDLDDAQNVEDKTNEDGNPGKTEEGGEGSTTDEEETEEELDPVIVEVNKLHGIDLQYELPEDILPDSPQGIYIRDKALIEHAQTQYEEGFKNAYPDAYKLALHMQAGGTVEDFKVAPTLPKFEEVKDNLEVQKSLYLRSLKEKGMEDDEAQTLLESRIKKNGLAPAVERYLEEKEVNSVKELEQIQVRAAQREREIQEDHTNFASVLSNLYNTKEFPLLRIADAKVQESYDKFVENVEYNEDTKTFEFKISLTNETIKDAIQMKYIMDNKNEFFKKKSDDVKLNQVRTIQRENKKIAAEQKTVVNSGLRKEWLE